MELSRHFIERPDGTQICWYVSGARGPVVLFANGLGGPVSALRPYIDHFAASRRVVTWDYRGLYASRLGPGAGLDMGTHAGDAAAIAEALGEPIDTYVGWSMGVQVGLELFRQAPESVKRLVLMNGTAGRPFDGVFPPAGPRVLGGLVQAARRLSFLAPSVVRTLRAAPRADVVLKRLGFIAEEFSSELYREVLLDFESLDFDVYFRLLAALGDHDAAQVLPTVTIPTLAIDGIQQAFHALPGSAGAKLELSGPGYFSVVVGAQTRHQADWIGRISTVGFIALLLLAYRSFSSLLLSALPIASAALAGIAALTVAFSEVHGITLAFGFTLLGVAQEYPIRVLSHRRAGEDAVQSVRALWPLLLTAIASACIAYLAFYASGVNGLRQLAVFTIVGLLVAGFSTRYLLSHLLPVRVRDVADMRWLAIARDFVDRLPRPRWIPVVVALAIVLMLAFARGSFWQNNLAALTPLPQDMLQHDARLRQALGAPDVRYLLVLQASSEQGVLALSEQLQPQVDALVAKHAVDALELPSRYLPTVALQQARQQKLPDRATLQQSLHEALQGLPFRPDLFQPFLDDVQAARALPPLTPERYAQTPLGQRLAAMLVQRDGHWLGLGTVSGVHDVAALQALGENTHGAVRLLDLKAASESLVVDYRTRILQALLVAAILLVLTITISLRSLRRAWHVLAPMTLATFLVLAVERVAGVEISLFHLVALILAGGLGLHYALFFERDTGDPAEQRRTLHATIVCVLSALLVFGMLAWATIPVLRAIGLTVSLGVAFHFCLSILMAPHAAED